MTATYPRDLVKQLAPLIDGLLVSEKPSREHLAVLLDVAWEATQLEEEGRATVFALAFADPDYVALQYTRAQFHGRRPFDQNAIAKLAPAAHHEQTLIAVWPDDDGVLRIWGLLHVGDPTFAIDLVNPPSYLRIIGARPGALDVAVGNVPLVRYAHGVAHWYERDEKDMTDALRPTAAIRSQDLRVGPGALAHEFERLAERLVRAGHGGAILVYDSTARPHTLPAGVSIPLGSLFTERDLTLQTAFVGHERTIAGDTSKEDRRSAERRHRDALDYVARLANVDGAVLMYADLSVAGFGASIEIREDMLEGMIVVETDPRNRADERPFDMSRVGQRHKSAIHYCAAQLNTSEPPGRARGVYVAFAIVASQDGTLSLMAIRPPGVLVLRPFVLSQTIVRNR